MRKLLREFKEFAMRGNVLDLAVGVMIGGAFGKITTSLVNDVFMPVIGLITGGIDLSGLFIALDGNSYPSAQAAADAGVGTLNYGAFLTSIIDFLLIAICVFLFMRVMNKLMHKKKAEEEPAPAPRLCPFCKGEIHQDATRCPHCTSVLDADGAKTA